MSAAPSFEIRAAHSSQGPERCLVAELIANQAVLALLHELATWPKPGLVSPVGSSHTDMDPPMMHASAKSLRPFFVELAAAGWDGADMGRLRTIGLRPPCWRSRAASIRIGATSLAWACCAPRRVKSPNCQARARTDHRPRGTMHRASSRDQDRFTWFSATLRSSATDFRIPSMGETIMSSCSMDRTSS
jgi:hypothetical protein